MDRRGSPGFAFRHAILPKTAKAGAPSHLPDLHSTPLPSEYCHDPQHALSNRANFNELLVDGCSHLNEKHMTKSTRRKARRFGKQVSELTVTVPQVIAHRLARMATAGAIPSRRDQREFHRMGAEKLAAFGESWNAMAVQMLRTNQQLAQSIMRIPWAPFGSARGHAPVQPWSRTAWRAQSAAFGLLSKGLSPVHRRVVANAKRLNRTKAPLWLSIGEFFLACTPPTKTI